PGAGQRIDAQRSDARSQFLQSVTARRPLRIGTRCFIDEFVEVSVNFDLAPDVTLSEAHRRRTQQLEECWPVTYFHLRNRRLLPGIVFGAVPQLERNARVTRQGQAPLGEFSIELALDR